MKSSGFLVCDRCELAVPYTGYEDPVEGDGWPQHRCAAARVSTIEPFTRWSDLDPFREPLPGVEAVIAKRYQKSYRRLSERA